MKNAFTTTLIALVAAAGFAAAPAFAESPLAGQSAAIYGERTTRAAVAAEMVEFKKGPNPWSISYNQAAQLRSVTSRAEVKAGVAQAHAANQGVNLNGENDNFAQASTPIRASGAVAQAAARPAL